MYQNPWNKTALLLRADGRNYPEVLAALSQKYPKLTYDAVRGYLKRIELRYGTITEEVIRKIENFNNDFDNEAASDSMKPGEVKIFGTEMKDGETTFQAIIAMQRGNPLTKEAVMEAHNLDPELWEMVSYKSNVWQAQQSEGRVVDLYQSKITVKPLSKPFTTKDIENWFESKDFSSFKPLPAFRYSKSKEILEIDYTDMHVGLLAWAAECGANFDLKIIKRRFESSVADIIERCRGRKFKLVRFVTLGDILHVDNSKQTTTNGTFQQIDGRIPKIFDMAVDMLTDALGNLLKELKAPIEYVYVAGNHDRDTGYYLAKTIEMAFKREPNISFDNEPNPRKAKVYGKALVGYCHGDMPSKNLGTWLMQDYRKEFGNSFYAEIHSGHLHSKSEEAMNGINVIRLPALCESSYWEHQMGYKAERALICYVWNEDTGKREQWITNF